MTSSPDTYLKWIPPLFGARSRPAAAVVADGVWRPAELRSPKTAPVPAPNEADEAYGRGYTEGQRDGVTRAAEGLAPVATLIRNVAERLETDRVRFVRDRQRDLEALSMAIARKLVGRAVTEDATVVADLVQRALDLMPADAPIEIRVSLADLEALSGHIERIAPTEGQAMLRWVADPSLERGSFVLDSPSRVVDGRIDLALGTLYDRLELD